MISPLVVCAAALLAASPAAASTITPDTTSDDIVPNGNCTLREATIAANEDRPVDRCPGGTGADEIRLGDATYRLLIPGGREDASNRGDLDLLAPASVIGIAGKTRLVGPVSDRVLHVLGGPVKLEGLIITGGDPSGEGSSVYGPEGRGGGVLVQSLPGVTGRAAISDSTISGNRAALGGGLAVSLDPSMSPFSQEQEPPITAGFDIQHTTITGNLSTGDGGGIFGDWGGANLENTTISANRAADEGGAIGGHGIFQITASTIADNSAARAGGIASNGPGASYPNGSHLGGVILADNTADVAPNCSGEIESIGYNVFGDDTGCTVTTKRGSDLVDADPELGPLAANGGPTLTHAIGEGSPANDLGSANFFMPGKNYFCASVDQRGLLRHDSPHRFNGCDTGAYQYVECGGREPTIWGGIDPDRISGTGGIDVITSFRMEDRIRGGGGADLICSGSEEDRIFGGAGEDLIQASNENDVLKGGPGSDRLFGGSGDDRCIGGPGVDRFHGCEVRRRD